MRYTKMPTNTFKKLQLNAGIITSDFDVEKETYTSIAFATSGGVQFTATPSFEDWGDDIDNCPKNTKELKHISEWEVKLSGTAITVDTTAAKLMMGAADIDSTNEDLVTPRADLDATKDFADLWWIGDYSDKNGETGGGYIAIHVINALSTGGFQLQSGDKEKGNFSFEFTGHSSTEDLETVPFEVYIKSGT